MIRDNLKDFNLIDSYDGEAIIGFYEDIVSYFKAVAKDYIDKLDIADYKSISEVLDLLMDLDRNYDCGALGVEDLLEIGYHPMGCYTICKRVLEEEK